MKEQWMPNDAKLGLVVGVSLVILIALVYFRRDGGPPSTDGQTPATEFQTAQAKT